MSVIEHVDQVLLIGDAFRIEELKQNFGLGTVEHNADFGQYVLHFQRWIY